MRALILSILVSFTPACITGDNQLEDEQAGEGVEEQADDIVETDDLPPLTYEPAQRFGDRLDALDGVLDTKLQRDTRWPRPHKGSDVSLGE